MIEFCYFYCPHIPKLPDWSSNPGHMGISADEHVIEYQTVEEENEELRKLFRRRVFGKPVEEGDPDRAYDEAMKGV